ncbi:hypothetical protein CO058_01760 [candidate division WWE3 bacterium CG_4_9_14_0_2_um_filter_35_11]|uniref:Phosphoribosyltransferase domain-containing protein n=1 Tax=candidate division WWE3 bacterium CG_4_9_14_0_2_um_filter_35_11 TaxID=1975077 RepID=A0A2M8ELY8_UNCKA|nr:MAG: hypothetical protein COV25_03795 [candidate division WWE3 bacterium CG10_big_fil_rev_8_21_14_0_10_35_32]PJC23751.1 MAG: hypothetical protein CO058_01760 [candidate division WWE3 bacterium CG_4_9_14_0_2_um_filter_35_11]
MNKINYSLEEFHRDCHILSTQIINDYQPTSIVMLVRGGIPVGAWIAQSFQTKYIYTSACVPSGGVNGKVLFISDICRSAETIRKVFNNTLSKEIHVTYKLACIHYSPTESDLVPDFYVREISPDDWIHYPWEFMV